MIDKTLVLWTVVIVCQCLYKQINYAVTDISVTNMSKGGHCDQVIENALICF